MREVFTDQSTDYQFENALWVGFYGGYGMFTDDVDVAFGDATRTLPGGPAEEACLCHDCAHDLCATVPWIASLLRPEHSHSHARWDGVDLDGHIGWDLPPKPPSGWGEKTGTCGCGRPAAPNRLRLDGAISAVCTTCWSKGYTGGWCHRCDIYADLVFTQDPDAHWGHSPPAVCVFCLAKDSNGRVRSLAAILKKRPGYMPAATVEHARTVFRAYRTARDLTARGMGADETAVAVYLEHGIRTPTCWRT